MVSAGTRTADMNFRKRVEIWSGSLSLCGFRLFHNFSTPLTMTVMFGAVLYGEDPKLVVLVTSSVVNTDENCLLIIYDFFAGVE